MLADSSLMAADRRQPLADLLILVAGGDRQAFADLYRQIAWKVLALATSTLRDGSQAEEVTQEVFLEIWQRASSFDSAKGSASAWVMRLAHARSVAHRSSVHQPARMLTDSAYRRRSGYDQSDCPDWCELYTC